MNYYFQGFYFNSEELVLKKNQLTINLHPNETKILAVLLGASTKGNGEEGSCEAALLEVVPNNKTIANYIKNLQKIFGENAILFSQESGHLWNIPIDKIEDPTVENSSSEKKRYLIIIIVLAIIFSVGGFLLWPG